MDLAGLGKAKLLDYVAAFIVKGLEYMNETRAEMALVSTSSICQGEQVALLWPRIFKAANVKFAYVPFKWANAAARNAGVWCTRSEERRVGKECVGTCRSRCSPNN